MQLHGVSMCIHKDHLFYFPIGSGLTTCDLFRHSGLMPHGFQLLGSYQTLPTLAMLTAGHYQVDTGLTVFYRLMLTKGEICLFFHTNCTYSHPHIVYAVSNQWVLHFGLEKHGKNTQFCKMYPLTNTVLGFLKFSQYG